MIAYSVLQYIFVVVHVFGHFTFGSCGWVGGAHKGRTHPFHHTRATSRASSRDGGLRAISRLLIDGPIDGCIS